MSEAWRDIIRSITIKGRYRTEGSLVTVEAEFGGSKTTQIGGSPPDALASIMLRELAEEKLRGG
jgi:hypothetical protein